MSFVARLIVTTRDVLRCPACTYEHPTSTPTVQVCGQNKSPTLSSYPSWVSIDVSRIDVEVGAGLAATVVFIQPDVTSIGTNTPCFTPSSYHAIFKFVSNVTHPCPPYGSQVPPYISNE